MIPILEGAGLVAGLITGVLDRVLPKKMTEAERASVELELMKVDWQAQLGQLEINRTEAASGNAYAASWRPTIGYVCAASFAWTFVLQPFASCLLALYYGPQTPVLPQLDTNALMPVLLGMLGLAGARSYEKVRGKT